MIKMPNTGIISIKSLMDNLRIDPTLAKLLHELISDLQHYHANIQTRLEEARKALERSEEEKERLKKLEKTIVELEKSISDRQGTIDNLTGQLATSGTINQKMRDMLRSFREDIAARDEEIKKLMKEKEGAGFEEKEKSEKSNKDHVANKDGENRPYEEPGAKKDSESETRTGTVINPANPDGNEALNPLDALEELAKNDMKKRSVADLTIDHAMEMIGLLASGEEIKVIDLKNEIRCPMGRANTAAQALIEIGLAIEGRMEGLRSIRLTEKVKKLLKEDQTIRASDSTPGEDKLKQQDESQKPTMSPYEDIKNLLRIQDEKQLPIEAERLVIKRLSEKGQSRLPERRKKLAAIVALLVIENGKKKITLHSLGEALDCSGMTAAHIKDDLELLGITYVRYETAEESGHNHKQAVLRIRTSEEETSEPKPIKQKTTDEKAEQDASNILKLVINSPGGIFQQEIIKQTGLSQTAVSSITEDLTGKGLVIKEIIGRQSKVTAVLESIEQSEFRKLIPPESIEGSQIKPANINEALQQSMEVTAEKQEDEKLEKPITEIDPIKPEIVPPKLEETKLEPETTSAPIERKPETAINLAETKISPKPEKEMSLEEKARIAIDAVYARDAKPKFALEEFTNQLNVKATDRIAFLRIIEEYCRVYGFRSDPSMCFIERLPKRNNLVKKETYQGDNGRKTIAEFCKENGLTGTPIKILTELNIHGGKRTVPELTRELLNAGLDGTKETLKWLEQKGVIKIEDINVTLTL